jgi:hypothetical protein
MIDESAAVLPIWMLISAAFGFLVGELCGDQSRHRKCLQETNEELRERLQEANIGNVLIHRTLKQQRGVINDIHGRLVAVSKSLGKRPS